MSTGTGALAVWRLRRVPALISRAVPRQAEGGEPASIMDLRLPWPVSRRTGLDAIQEQNSRTVIGYLHAVGIDRAGRRRSTSTGTVGDQLLLLHHHMGLVHAGGEAVLLHDHDIAVEIQRLGLRCHRGRYSAVIVYSAPAARWKRPSSVFEVDEGRRVSSCQPRLAVTS